MKTFKEYHEELEDTIEEHLHNRGIKFLYHGTHPKYKDSIKKNGLKSNTEKNYDQSKTGIYLTINKEMAEDWAMDAFEDLDENEVITYKISIIKLNLNNLMADTNIEFNDKPDNFIYKGIIKI